MNRAVTLSCLLCMCFALSSCHPAREPLNVQVQPGLVTATDAQARLISKLKSFQRGMSPQDVQNELGRATEETLDSLFYYLCEDRFEGGYYVAATLTFRKGGLESVEVGFGHESREPGTDE